MEEVWIVYLCLILLVLVYFLMNRKPDDEIKSEKDLRTAPVSSSYSSGSVGRRLECSEEELEQSLERLVGVFSKADARKREAPHEHGASTQQRESSGRGPSQAQVLLGKGRKVFASQRSLVPPWLERSGNGGRSWVSKDYLIGHRDGELLGDLKIVEDSAGNMAGSLRASTLFLVEYDPAELSAWEKPSRPKSHESLVNEIEQAVQETVDADAYVRRRQAQPAPRSHREVQRPELSEKF
ncbi:UNVERIFIED_CONTAM: hypothetical protein K2H54_015126 [Gekko kuhli]